MPNQKKSFLPVRAQMFLGGFGVWCFFAAWTMSAFLQHIDDLKPTYRLAAQCGAAGAEFVVLVMVFLHCFSIHIGVRKWALILGSALAVVCILHAGMLRGLDEATIKQVETEKSVEETMIRVSNEQAAETARINRENSVGLQRKERLAMDARSQAEQAKIRQAALDKIAATVAGRTETVKRSSWLPLWYINGGMYSVMFIAAILAYGLVNLGQLNHEDVDRDYDGRPDNQQIRQPQEMVVVGEDFDRDHIPQTGKAKPSWWSRLRGKP